MNDYHHQRSSSRRYGDGGGSRDYDEKAREDNPPNSRLFVIGGKNVSESEFREAFGEFGQIEWLDIKKDRTTGAPKGITYVKYGKTSEAAAALEELNGKSLGSDPRPLKIVIASSRGESGGGGGRSEDDELKATRLFLVVPKSMTEEELRQVFGEYGPIEHITIVRDKQTGNPRGLAYVRYYRFSHAAKAFEECDASFKPKFAEPKPVPGGGVGGGMGGGGNSRGMGTSASDRGSNSGNYGYGGGNFGGGYSSSSSSQLSMAGNFMGGGSGDNMMPQQQHNNNNMAAVFGMIQQQTNSSSIQNNSCCRLRVLFNPSMSKDMFWSLFNIVPGLEHCELIEMAPEGAWGGVIYNNPRSAAWAIERIHNFEYPTGSKLVVTHDDMAPRTSGGGVFQHV